MPEGVILKNSFEDALWWASMGGCCRQAPEASDVNFENVGNRAGGSGFSQQ